MARTRYANSTQETRYRDMPAAALRAVLREGYSPGELRGDVLAGLIVGVVALPLAMALAIAVGAPPQHGLYTAIVAGAIIAALGGSRVQVSGPTAAFVVILAPIHARFGLGGLLVSGALAGAMLVAMGLLRMGRLIQFVPHPVTTGFTAGIATVIAGLQLKDLLGLAPTRTPDQFFERMGSLWEARSTASGWELLVGAVTLALLIALPKLTKRIPGPLVALPVAAGLAYLLGRLVPGLHLNTIATRFHYDAGGVVMPGIPRLPPSPVLPWSTLATPFDLAMLRALMPGAFAIAMLGAIESLLSAVVADGMARTRHDPDAELVAQGIGNLVAPFFGGIPATGAIARTATNVRNGGRSPVAALVHSATVLVAVLAAAPLLGWLPMSGLAALLVLVAYNMSELKHFVHTLRVAPRSDVAVLLTCFGLTVSFDMVIGVSVGMVLAALLFMRRMAEVTQARAFEGTHPALPPIPAGVIVYDVSGPLFFGAAERAMSALGQIGDRARAVVLRLDDVHAIDATGLVALDSALDQLAVHHVIAVLSGLHDQPRKALERAGVPQRPGVVLADDVPTALAIAATASAEWRGPPREAHAAAR
jgi:sulfate permease, SulP family